MKDTEYINELLAEIIELKKRIVDLESDRVYLLERIADMMRLDAGDI